MFGREHTKVYRGILPGVFILPERFGTTSVTRNFGHPKLRSVRDDPNTRTRHFRNGNVGTSLIPEPITAVTSDTTSILVPDTLPKLPSIQAYPTEHTGKCSAIILLLGGVGSAERRRTAG